LRSTFSSSRLVRLLRDSVPADAQASGLDVAERLGLWVNAFDAIGLQSAHQSIRTLRTAAPASAAARPIASGSMAEDVQRVRATLANAVARAAASAAASADGGVAAYRQRHLELQRQMEQMIGPLRDHVRQALAQASGRLRQLAALDAVFEQVLSRREQALLPGVAALLERRFEQLRAGHEERLAAGAAEDDAAAASDDWREVFAREWRQALLAELDLRLEPVAGLVEALSNESKNPE
jgi:hypothetical protein